MWVVLRQSVLNQVLKVSSGKCQQSVEVLSKSATFLDFQISQGTVATYCRYGGNVCDILIENFLANQLVKQFWKLVHICQSYYQTSRGLVFLEHGVVARHYVMMMTCDVIKNAFFPFFITSMLFPCPGKRHRQYFGHNFDKFKYIVVINILQGISRR